MPNNPITKAPFPHCDQHVLHAPQKCEFCDKYPELQEERTKTNTNFTGEQDLTKNPCPAEKARSLKDINKWSGNRPEGYVRTLTFARKGSKYVQ